MKRLLPYMKKYSFFAILCPLFMVLEVMADIIIPSLMAKIVDVGIENRDIDYVVKIGTLMIIIAFIGMILGIVSAHFGAKAGLGFASEIRKETFEKVQGYSFANLDEFSVSSLITRLTNDTNTLGQVTMMSLRMGVRFPFMMVFAFIMAFRINSYLATILAGAMILTTVFMVIILTKARPLFLKMQYRVDRVNSIIKENLTAIGVIKSFNRQDHEQKRFKERNDDLRDLALKASALVMVLMPVLNLIVYSTIVVILWLGGQQVVAGVMGKGELISFVTYITQVMMALAMISMFFMQLLRGMASADRIVEVWDAESEIKETNNPVKQLTDGSIKFRDVCFAYPGSTEETLRDINISIESGEIIGIIGSTGSSKSTLVQLIPRLYDVAKGNVEVGGVNVKDYDIKVLRDEVAFVLQKNSLFSGTIKGNMQWGNENATDDEIIKALKQAQAWDFVSKYKDGINHRVEQGGNNFSGGQKQRLSIARSLMKNPKVIILDDSTSAVDMDTDARIQNVFSTELGDVTTIIIAQRISSIEYVDRIIVLHEGRIESIGNHDELLEKSPVYSEIYESQKKGAIRE